ncbi:DegT/DnrJ/EryC1/StrS family aminotransferase [Micromonospora sp. SD12]|uniref:DegT/DnrJ/EryC1/StrS family aminotransferase n=1 Tax=Micromonospora sp. SD12 TaxID=3452216 RepID=UPI003F888D33
MTSLPSDQDTSGRTLGAEELALLGEVIASGVLNSTRGTQTARFEKAFGELLGHGRSAIACNSGSAAVHTAVAALDLEPGDEVIVSPLTDVGGVAPVLWQGCIPVFADVDPYTLNITADSVAARITPQTRAVIVTHLFGNPADVSGILAVARQHNLYVLEDCAQAFGAETAGQPVGTLGDLACFSLQQTKHITTGEGGLVCGADAQLVARAHQFVNKARIYSDPEPEHHFLAMNYRMTELQGAVGVAQLEKLPEVVRARRENAARLVAALDGVAGVSVPGPLPGAQHSYWKIPLQVDPAVLDGGGAAFGAGLAERGVGSAPGYQRPAWTWSVIAHQRTFGTSRYPFTLARPEALDYSPERYPGTLAGRASVVVLPWNERYTKSDVDQIATAIDDVAATLRRQ